MNDLRISYADKDNKVHFMGYSTIMDFTDYIEENPTDHITEGHHVKAEFFENPLHQKDFNTIMELYDFCKRIIK